jgi:outer membrane protein OmpA-like peptidoglycan-associated protein
MPETAPPPPRLSGVAATTAPTPPPATPVPPAPPPKIVSGAPVPVAFPPGSAVLPTSALASLKALTQQRGDGTIEVTGYGDAASSDAVAQSSALPLALARARAIAANLLASGVPGNAIHINAEATGSGGVARLGAKPAG